MHIKTGDEVVVTSGNHQGMRGKVLRIIKEDNRVFIEGVNVRAPDDDIIVLGVV